MSNYIHVKQWDVSADQYHDFKGWWSVAAMSNYLPYNKANLRD